MLHLLLGFWLINMYHLWFKKEVGVLVVWFPNIGSVTKYIRKMFNKIWGDHRNFKGDVNIIFCSNETIFQMICDSDDRGSVHMINQNNYILLLYIRDEIASGVIKLCGCKNVCNIREPCQELNSPSIN